MLQLIKKMFIKIMQQLNFNFFKFIFVFVFIYASSPTLQHTRSILARAHTNTQQIVKCKVIKLI